MGSNRVNVMGWDSVGRSVEQEIKMTALLLVGAVIAVAGLVGALTGILIKRRCD